MRPKGPEQAPIGTDHDEIARDFIDSWLEELEVATFRRLRGNTPNGRRMNFRRARSSRITTTAVGAGSPSR
jgi:hypothetical protein